MITEFTNISPRIGGQRRSVILPSQPSGIANGSNDTIGKFNAFYSSLNNKKFNDFNNAGQNHGLDKNKGREPEGIDIQKDDNSGLGNNDANNSNACIFGHINSSASETGGNKSSQKAISDSIPPLFRTGKLADIINHIENSSHNSRQAGAGPNQQSNGLAESIKEEMINAAKNQLQGESTEINSNRKSSIKPPAEGKTADGRFGNSYFNSGISLLSSFESIADKKAIQSILKGLDASIEISSGNGKPPASSHSIRSIVMALLNLTSNSKFMKVAEVNNNSGLADSDDKTIESKIIAKLNSIATNSTEESSSDKPATESKQIWTLNTNASNQKSRVNDNINKLAENDKDNGDEKPNPDLSNEKNENSLNNKSAPQGKFIKAINSKIKTEFAVSRTAGGSESTVPDRIINIRPSEFAGKAMQLVKNAPAGGRVSARMVLRPASLGTVFVNVTMNGNIASLDIKVDSPEILKQLESQLSVLRDKLGQNGIKTEQLEIRLKGQGSTNNNFSGQFENFQGQKKERHDRQEFLKSYHYLAKAQAKLAGQAQYDEQGSLVESNN